MKLKIAPHEKLTDEQIEINMDKILENTLEMKKIFMYLDDTNFENLVDSNEECIFKIINHFFPERKKILKISIKELSEMFEKSYKKNE